MIQNLNESAIDNNEYKNVNQKKKERKKVEVFNNVFALSNIPIYIISLMISIVGIGGSISPFSISFLGACISNSVPIIGVVIFSIIGSAIKFGVSGALEYILVTLVTIASMFIIRPQVNEEEKNEKVKIAKNLFIATLIIGLAKVGISGFTVYDVLSIISTAMIVTVFYKIFVNSIIAISDFNRERAFSIEEILGASLILSISASAFGNLSILGFSIRNVISIFIVLVLGWKNGVLVGTTAGVTIGVTLGVITSADAIMVAAYAISGMIAGILNRFGKIGVIVGFCLGNVILAYVSNGNTVQLIHFKEILIASIGLLALPKSMRINIEEFMNGSKLLPVFPNRALNKSKETAEKLNNVSDTLQEMAKVYNTQSQEIDEEIAESNKDIFISELLDNLSGYENNMLYDDISNVQGQIVDKIFNTLLDKQEITRESLLKIFADCNSFIVSSDDKNISSYLDDNIMQMVRVINMSYKISKSNFVWQKKLKENKKNIETQLKGVSRAISSIADNIETGIQNEEKFENEKKQIVDLLKQKDINVQEISIQKDGQLNGGKGNTYNGRFLVEIYMDKTNSADTDVIEKILSGVLNEKIVFNAESSVGTRLNFLSDDKFVMAIGNSGTIKNGSDVSGDNLLTIRLKDGKYLVAISDGMGSGKIAGQSSSKALKMLENLLISGFDKNTSIELINSSLINQNEEVFATLDIAIVDLYRGNIEFIKKGACPTYIKSKKNVHVIKSNSLPAGIINNSSVQTFDKDIKNGDIVVMCTDGILDSNVEYQNKELWLKYLLEDIETTNTKKISDLILNESIDNNYGIAKDDMSVVVYKFLQKNK